MPLNLPPSPPPELPTVEAVLAAIPVLSHPSHVRIEWQATDVTSTHRRAWRAARVELTDDWVLRVPITTPEEIAICNELLRTQVRLYRLHFEWNNGPYQVDLPAPLVPYNLTQVCRNPTCTEDINRTFNVLASDGRSYAPRESIEFYWERHLNWLRDNDRHRVGGLGRRDAQNLIQRHIDQAYERQMEEQRERDRASRAARQEVLLKKQRERGARMEKAIGRARLLGVKATPDEMLGSMSACIIVSLEDFEKLVDRISKKG